MSGTSNPPDIILDMDITGPSIKISFMNIIIDTDLTGITINTNISDTISHRDHIVNIGITEGTITDIISACHGSSVDRTTDRVTKYPLDLWDNHRQLPDNNPQGENLGRKRASGAKNPDQRSGLLLLSCWRALKSLTGLGALFTKENSPRPQTPVLAIHPRAQHGAFWLFP
jgi:hypothetical protein